MTAQAFTQGMQVRQIAGADIGATGEVTRVIEPSMIFADGSPGDGEVHVTYAGIRFPRVRYAYGSAAVFIAPLT